MAIFAKYSYPYSYGVKYITKVSKRQVFVGHGARISWGFDLFYRVLYNVDGPAKFDIYGNFYVIYYDAVRTIRDTLISYKQDYKVNKTTKEITYLAEGTAKLNVEEVKAPNTGIDNNTNNYLYLLLVLIPLGYVSIKKLVK